MHDILRSLRKDTIALKWSSSISFVACRAEALAKAGQGFAVAYYSFTLDAADLQHPQLLQR